MIKKAELKIKNIRELKNLTQEYMAIQLNISLRAYSKIESGETQLTIKRINQISEILNINSLELLSFDESKIFTSTNTYQSNTFTQDSSEVIKQLKETIVLLHEQNKTLSRIFENRYLSNNS